MSSIVLPHLDIQRQYERVFNRFDENGDGKISPQELQQCMGSMMTKVSLKECETAVRLMDSDGDGLLSMEDFVKVLEGSGVGEEEKVKELKEAFGMYEVDQGCGFINADSLKRMLSRLGEAKSVWECKRMIAPFDLNSDGVLTFDEFKLMMMSS